MNNEWSKYTFVCNGDCDGLLEFTFRDGFGFPNGVVKATCPCGSETTYISMEYATITNKELEVA